MAEQKSGIKKLSKPADTEPMGHNRRISPFAPADFAAWAKAQNLDPLEELAARWLTDAEAMRRQNQPEIAKILEQHAQELKQAVAGSH